MFVFLQLRGFSNGYSHHSPFALCIRCAHLWLIETWFHTSLSFFPSSPGEIYVHTQTHTWVSLHGWLWEVIPALAASCSSHLSPDGALPVRTSTCTAQGQPFLQQIPLDPATRLQQLCLWAQLPSRHLAGCRRRQASSCFGGAAGSDGGDASRQCWSYCAACTLLLRAHTCLCQSVLLFSLTSPGLGHSLSPLIPLD